MIKTLKEAFALLPEKMRKPAAGQMVLAICCQESNLVYRRQLGNGPARGLPQFEKGNAKTHGGVWGVMNHKASRDLAREVCVARGIRDPNNIESIWAALEFDDVLALALARLLLWTDSKPMPEYQAEGWDTYLRVWNPGKPLPNKWPASWATARGIMDGR